MLKRLKRMGRLVVPSSAHYECRQCGTTVDTARGGCPACESNEIARYDV